MAHPVVLRVQLGIYILAKKWELAATSARRIVALSPHDSWAYIQLTYSLHALKRTGQALETLLPVAGKFSSEIVIPYNLACFCCQLGQWNESLKWLRKAIDLGGKRAVRHDALEDPDLEPLWGQINKI